MSAGRFIGITVGVVSAVFAFPAAAQATGTISIVGSLLSDHLHFEAGVGDDNDISLTQGGSLLNPTITVNDDVPITIDNSPDPTGCTHGANTTIVICPYDGGGGSIFGSTTFDFDLGDLDDVVNGSALTSHNVNLAGEAGNDQLSGGGGDDLIDGNEGNDTSLNGNGGDDTIRPGSGTNSSNGGTGTDTLDYNDAAVGVVTVNIGAGTGDDLEPATNFENATGGASADTLTGTAGANVLQGLGGGDTLNGGAGNDTLEGGDDGDTLNGEGDDDTLKGGAGTDTLNDGSGTDVLSWNDGRGVGVTVTLNATGGTAAPDSDTIASPTEILEGSGQNDVFNGHDLDDTFRGLGGEDTLNGNAGSDLLIGGSGKDANNGGTGTTDVASYEDRSSDSQLNLQAGTNADDDTFSNIDRYLGGTGTDTITGSNSVAENIDGNGGNDTIKGGSGPADTLAGGTGTDTVSYDDGRATGVTVDLAAGSGADGDTLSGFENATGSGANDRLTGNSSVNALNGGPGNDVLIGAGSADALTGGAGEGDTASYEERDVPIVASLAGGANPDGDTFNGVEGLGGGSAADVLTGDDAANVLNGGGGADRLIGGAGADNLNGSDPGAAGNDDDATDIASYEERATGVAAQLGGANPDGDIVSDIQGIAGGSGADTLIGDAGANTLIGNGGADTLLGGGGADALLGGAADGTPDADPDTVSYDDGRAAGITLDLGAATNGDGDAFADIQAFLGSDEGDAMAGGPGADDFNGGLGDDTLTGNDGDDRLVGAAGNDVLTGLAGADVFDAGVGDDKVFAKDGAVDSGDGGEGIDRAELDGNDSIANCEPDVVITPVIDRDGDGFSSAVDCNDASPSIRPGALETPGNAVDENCDGIAAPFPLLDVGIGNSFAFTRKTTTVKVLEVRRAPAGAKIKVTCKTAKRKRGCAFKSKTLTSKGRTVKLVSLFKKRKLPVGTRITITVTAPSTIGKVVTYTTRKSKAPRSTVRCLPPGATAAQKC